MAKLNKIVLHWTAGGKQPNTTDLKHYHFLVDGDGLIRQGIHSPEDNENCKDGQYAAHTGGGNTGAIGLALCGMVGYNDTTKECIDSTNMVTRVQFEAMFSYTAMLCKKYNIPIKNVTTHAEFGLTHPKTSSKGKIDINYIPYAGLEGVEECGDYIRNKIQWYYERKNNG